MGFLDWLFSVGFNYRHLNNTYWCHHLSVSIVSQPRVLHLPRLVRLVGHLLCVQPLSSANTDFIRNSSGPTHLRISFSNFSVTFSSLEKRIFLTQVLSYIRLSENRHTSGIHSPCLCRRLCCDTEPL